MAASIPVQPVIDYRLVNSGYHQMVELGSDNCTFRTYDATQATNQQISFQNILQLGSGVLIDSVAFVEYNFSVVYPAAANIILPGVSSAGAAVAPYTQVGADAPTHCFSQYPLHLNSINGQITINNVSYGYNSAQLVAVTKEWSVSKVLQETLASSCPAKNSTQAIEPASSTNLYPNSALVPVGQNQNTRANIFATSVNLDNGVITANFTIREPVMLPPFTTPYRSQPALAQVQSLGLQYTLSSPNGFLHGVELTGTNVPSVNITSASLILGYLTPDQSLSPIPALATYSFDSPDFQLTKVTNLPALGASIDVQTTSQKLTTVPKLYCVKVCHQAQNLQMNTSNIPAFEITNMQIQYGSYNTFIFSQQDLWVLFCKNSGNRGGLSYQQWRALGCPVIINPVLDMTGVTFAGQQGDASLMWSNKITYTSKNIAEQDLAYDDVDLTSNSVYVIEVFLANGSVSIGGGSCVWKNTSCTEAQLVDAVNNGSVPTDMSMKPADISAGSLLGGLKNVFHHARRVAGVVRDALPTVQKGLDVLAGSGASGGYMRKRR